MSDKKVEYELRVKTQGTAQLDQLEHSLNETAKSAKDVGAKAEIGASGMGAADKAAGGFSKTTGKLKDGLESVSSQLSRAKDQLLAFVGINTLANSVKDVAALADGWKNMSARLQLALGAQTDINQAMADVVKVAQATSSSLENTANLYGKLATAGRELGRSNQDALALTQTINQAVQLSGASAQASDAAIVQLIQGLQAGVLRGDEFNSVMEQSPRVARALADGLHVTVGELRALAEAGKLTATAVIGAMSSQAEVIAKEFSALPITIGRAVQNLQTEWQKFVGLMDSSSGASSLAAQGIASLTKHLDDVARVAAASGAALTAAYAVQGVNALRAAAAQMAATGGAAKLLATDLATLGKPIQIAIAVTGFEGGYQLGTWLRETFASARQLGVAIVGYAQATVSGLQFIKEAAAAVFTNDTIDAARERFEKRNAALRDVLSGMWKDAEKAPQAIGESADKAGSAVAGVGTAAQNTGQQLAYSGTAGAQGMGQVSASANTAREALEKLATAINTKPPADNGITKVVADLQAAKLRGDDVEVLLRANLPAAIDKLSGPELARFRADFIRAMDEAGIKGRALATGLGLIGQEAAKNLGVDLVAASNKTSVAFEESRGNLNVLIRTLPDLKAAGVDTAAVVGQAMSKMLDTAKNQAELDAVIRQVNVLRTALGNKIADGLIDQAKQKAVELKDELDQATPGITSVREAMKLLGITSDATLKDVATKSKEAFETLRNSGTASTRELSAGFERYATDAIAANKGVASEGLKVQASMYGMEVQVDSTGKAIVKAIGTGTEAVQQHRDAVDQTTGAYLALRNAAYEATSEIGKLRAAEAAAARKDGQFLTAGYLEDQAKWEDKIANGKKTTSDKDGFATDTNGNRIAVPIQTQRSVYENAKGQGLSEAQALAIAKQFISDTGEITGHFYTANFKAGENWFTEVQKAIDKLVLANAANNAATGTPGSPTTTVNVRITLPDGSIRVVPTTADGSRELIAALQSAKLSAGL